MSAHDKPRKNRYGQQITYRIQRFNPEKDSRPYFQEYKQELLHGETVLDAVIRLKETQDPTLSYRKSCRMGICGSCAMYVNGKPRLTCQQQINDLDSDVITIQPLPNFPIIRDMVPDLTSLFKFHLSVKPYIIREDKEEMKHPTGEYYQTNDQLLDYLQFAYCIKCAACLSACPTCANDDHFTGPQALAQAYRYSTDTRDGGVEERHAAPSIDGRSGVFRCHFAGACSEACPKGVDPALGIQLLKREVTLKALRAKYPAPLAKQPSEPQRKFEITPAPEKTVK